MGTTAFPPTPERSANRNLARPPPLPQTLMHQEMAVDFALGDWEPFDRSACAREEQPSSPAAKRPHKGLLLVVKKEPPAASEAAAVAAFLGAPDAAWNKLPGGDFGATWQRAQAAGARLGLGSHRAAQTPSRVPLLESVCAVEELAGDDEGGDHSPALVSFDGSVGGGSDDGDSTSDDDGGAAAPVADMAVAAPSRRVTPNIALSCYVAFSES
jgi:hypothetical protein